MYYVCTSYAMEYGLSVIKVLFCCYSGAMRMVHIIPTSNLSKVFFLPTFKFWKGRWGGLDMIAGYTLLPEYKLYYVSDNYQWGVRGCICPKHAQIHVGKGELPTSVKRYLNSSQCIFKACRHICHRRWQCCVN